jgi:hypothetical protein
MVTLVVARIDVARASATVLIEFSGSDEHAELADSGFDFVPVPSRETNIGHGARRKFHGKHALVTDEHPYEILDSGVVADEHHRRGAVRDASKAREQRVGFGSV